MAATDNFDQYHYVITCHYTSHVNMYGR